ncbi:DUF2225 domain-containing protein [Bacillus sp. ISL-47]|uniref:DUF2225 domain-containing protein n=1 Tax=Bacillus sp. ISL-47 TaxID=2819130 RepID=UPI001BE99EC5|nr:DUF2225 domain-containing protein [Bacillus sp. ISL-47]MBT2687572.1 DUF2225 domain-containing protein [Bacillus sp. ISL-47]MBT2706431.1 DUF2225 domain-containing protein [Pseudomonas sp. ISL-84]
MQQLEPTYDKKLECKVCKKSFTTKKLRSRFVKVSSYDTDFCPSYSAEGMNPLYYHIHTCPHCGFSESEDFSPYFPPGALELIKLKVADVWKPHDYSRERSITDAISTYKLAVYCGTLKKEKHLILAGLYMRLAWMYRSLKNTEQEQRFMKLAIKEYLESYMADDFRGSPVSETRLFYLVGELSKRTQQIEQAIKYFSKVIEKRSQEPKLIEMAREQWYEMRAEQKSAVN